MDTVIIALYYIVLMQLTINLINVLMKLIHCIYTIITIQLSSKYYNL